MKDERFVLTEEDIIFQEDKNKKRINRLNKILNSQKENLDYRYDVKAYKEYLKEWLKHKDEKEYLNGGVLSFAEFWEYDIDYEFEDYKKILKLIDEYNKKNELVTNGGKGSGNFNPGQGRGIGKPGKGSNATNVYEKYKDRKNPKPKSLSDSERELRIGTIINNAERMGINLEDIKEDDAYKIMKFIGWEENENGTISTEFGLEKISDKEVKDNDYIVFNGTDSKDGFDSLRDGGYRSRIIDENDGPGIYTSEYYDVALEYSKGEGDRAHKERITPIRIDNSNIISRDDVNKKLRNFNRNFLKNLPDSAVAALAGYDAMWTGNDDREVVILKPGSAEIIELDEK